MSLKKLMALMAICLSTNALAEEIYTTVFNVIESKKTESLLILSGSDGRIYKAAKTPENKDYYNALIGKVVRLDFSKSGEELLVNRARVVSDKEANPEVYDLNRFQYNELRKFAPTDLVSYENVEKVFSTMLNDGDKRQSQCFKRAHIWSYDMWTKSNVESEKAFIFYTRRFIQVDEYGWWFHVAPMVTAGSEKYVLDPTFMNKPVTLEAWKTRFVKNSSKITCPVAEKYNDFYDNQWNRLCYLIITPMYHFRPMDIKMRDTQNKVRNHWVLSELQDARRAFKDGEKTYEGLDTGKRTVTH